MRAITVRQPWAWAIAHGGKTIENRSQGTAYRGPLLIHAGKGWSERGAEDPRVVDVWKLEGRPCSVARRYDDGLLMGYGPAVSRKRGDLPLGMVVAVAQLVDSHPDAGCCRPWGESSYAEAAGRVRIAVHHLVLEDVVPLAEPVPCLGALGLWRPPADVVRQAGAATVRGGR